MSCEFFAPQGSSPPKQTAPKWKVREPPRYGSCLGDPIGRRSIIYPNHNEARLLTSIDRQLGIVKNRRAFAAIVLFVSVFLPTRAKRPAAPSEPPPTPVKAVLAEGRDIPVNLTNIFLEHFQTWLTSRKSAASVAADIMPS